MHSSLAVDKIRVYISVLRRKTACALMALAVSGALAVFVVGSNAQQRLQVIDAAALQRNLTKLSDPNPFSELAHGSGFRVTVRRRTQRDVANRHDRRVEVYHVL